MQRKKQTNREAPVYEISLTCIYKYVVKYDLYKAVLLRVGGRSDCLYRDCCKKETRSEGSGKITHRKKNM